MILYVCVRLLYQIGFDNTLSIQISCHHRTVFVYFLRVTPRSRCLIDTERLALQGAIVRAGTSATRTSNDACGTPVTLYQSLVNDWIECICDPSVVARYVFVEIPASSETSQLTLCEVKVWQCGMLPGGNQHHITHSHLYRYTFPFMIQTC